MMDKGDGAGGVTRMVGLQGCGVLREGVSGVVGKMEVRNHTLAFTYGVIVISQFATHQM